MIKRNAPAPQHLARLAILIGSSVLSACGGGDPVPDPVPAPSPAPAPAPKPEPKPDPKVAARKARIEGAIPPKGDGNAPPPTKTDDDSFEEGFRSG